MTLTSYISASMFIFLSAFVIKEKAALKQSASLSETKWTLKRIHTIEGKIEMNGKAFIIFHTEKNSAGGNGGCNSFGSTLNVDGNNLSLTRIFSTKMYCEGVQENENAFLKQLAAATRFVITGNTLAIYNGKNILLEFSASKE